MKKYILLIVSSMMLASCVDTIILPDDRTVDEDFWKTKQQVSSMVTAAYSSMASYNVMEDLLVWGNFRTDEVFGPSSSVDNSTEKTALNEILAVNIQTTNMYAKWASIYEVINRCNIVLDRAEAVQTEDPSYTLGDYQTDRSQMLALRALCYFYLVRNFRDVPYITEAYMNSSQNMQVAQSAPAVVLQHCIDDLEEAAVNPIKAIGKTTSDWQRVGLMTDDAINTLLADIYLWRASVTHSQADYAQCIAYCDKVIQSKKDYREAHPRGYNQAKKEYPLADAVDIYSELFVSQNAEESIFELQSRNNTAINKYYYKYKSANNNGGEGWMRATNMFANTYATININNTLSNSNLYFAGDMRYYAACYTEPTSDDAYHIRKLVSNASVSGKSSTAVREVLGTLDRNLNIYRLTDIMLMKAEAIVQQVDTNMAKTVQDSLLRGAFSLVQAVNSRALHPDNQGDSIKWTSAAATSRFSTLTKDQFEQLILQERMREFCFEGRRWYDLMRYNYRHVNGVDYNRTLAEIVDDGGEPVANYKEMLVLMTRKRSDASGVQAKMANEAYLYMPIPNSDIIVCPLLRQNPAYKDASDYKKNY